MDSQEFFVHGRRTQAAKQLDDPSLLSTDHIFFRVNLRSPMKSEDSPQKQRIKRPLCTGRRTQAAKQLDDPSLQCVTQSADHQTRTPNPVKPFLTPHNCTPNRQAAWRLNDACTSPPPIGSTATAPCHHTTWRHDQPNCTRHRMQQVPLPRAHPVKTCGPNTPICNAITRRSINCNKVFYEREVCSTTNSPSRPLMQPRKRISSFATTPTTALNIACLRRHATTMWGDHWYLGCHRQDRNKVQ